MQTVADFFFFLQIEENISYTDFTAMTTNMMHPLIIENNIF